MKTFLLILMAFGMLYAEELDDLLDVYTHNSDLSEKTRLENGGSVIVFTRQDLEVMQARNLKDLLKSNPFHRYTESRLGLPDLLYSRDMAHFRSSKIRVYIDNQEITYSTYGSGFITAGDIDLDFVDHVEIYSQSPSYEFSTEPTHILIKLYSKVAERDRGGALRLSYGSRGFNEEFASYAQELEELSYYAMVYRKDDRTASYESHGVPVKRDEERMGLFATLYDKYQKLQVIVDKSDPSLSINTSPRATYAVSEANIEHLQVGYENTYFDDLFFSIVYQEADVKGHQKEAAGFESPLSPEVEYDRHEHALTAEMRYDLQNDDNRLIVGAKLRDKHFVLESVKIDGVQIPAPEFDRQDVFTIFGEERYDLADNSIINIAAQYADVKNNGGIDDVGLWQFRLSHTFLYEELVFKTFAYHHESMVEPFFYTDFPTIGSLDPMVMNAFSEEIKYQHDKSALKYLFVYRTVEDMTKQNASGGFVNTDGKLKGIATYLEYTYDFDIDNKIVANASFKHSYNIPVSHSETGAFIRSLNRIGKYDVFNELIYDHHHETDKDYYDYSAGVKYHYDSDLTLSIKGENIFNTGYEESYPRFDPNTRTQETPLLIAPIEQRFYATVEYLF